MLLHSRPKDTSSVFANGHKHIRVNTPHPPHGALSKNGVGLETSRSRSVQGGGVAAQETTWGSFGKAVPSPPGENGESLEGTV